MPIFEYSCLSCRHGFETLVRNGDPIECPKCKSQKLEKRYSVFGAKTAEGTSAPSASPGGGCRNQGGHCGCA